MPQGRPEKPVDWKKVDELLMAGCLGTEIAAHFDMCADSFYNKVKEKYNLVFSAYSLEKKQQGDSLIKKAQYDKAVIDKDNTMLVWLGKTRLKQKDESAITNNNFYFNEVDPTKCNSDKCTNQVPMPPVSDCGVASPQEGNQ